MSTTPDESGGEQPDCGAKAPILEELRRLLAEIERLPSELQAGLRRALEDCNANYTRRTRVLSQVHEALEQLRLDMKYLMFDLEATRRERDDALRSRRGRGEEND